MAQDNSSSQVGGEPPASTAPKGSLGIILLTLFISMVGIGIIIPILPLYAQEFNASEFQIGLVLAVYSICQFVFSPFLGKLSDRFGRRPVLLLSTLGSAVGFLIMGLAGSLGMLFVARIIDGVSGANVGTGQAYIADITSRKERGRAMGLMGATLGLGFVFGPVIGGVLSTYSTSLPYFVVAGLSVVNFLLILVRLPESRDLAKKEEKPEKAGLLQHTDRKVFVGSLLANFLSVCGFAVMTACWALFLKERLGYGGRESGFVLGYIGLIGILVQGGLVRRLLKKEGAEQRVAVMGAIILALSLALMPIIGGLWSILLVSTGLAIGNSLLTPTLNAIASLSASSEYQGRALGVLQSSSSLGRAVGPMLGGWLLMMGMSSNIGGYASLAFWVSGGMMFLTAAVLIFQGRPKEVG